MSAALELSEAVPLGYAVMARVAEDVGVRLLAIKGPVLELQGLRGPRQSADIDVLIDPARFGDYLTALDAIGWRNLIHYDCPTPVPKHSATHRHPRWPCEVDVHHWFPGFLADASSTFDVLWRRRVHVTLAAYDVPTLDLVAHGALAALHYLRDDGRAVQAGQTESLAQVMEQSWTAAQRIDLMTLAAETGASEALRPLLVRLGLPTNGSSVPLVVSVADWRLRSEPSTPGVVPWLVGLRRASWGQRPRLLLRALWPDSRQLNGVDPTDPPRGRALLTMRWSRLRRGLRLLPSAMRDLRRQAGERHG